MEKNKLNIPIHFSDDPYLNGHSISSYERFYYRKYERVLVIHNPFFITITRFGFMICKTHEIK